jgi:inositol 1,4,5-triphosphate receptor type 3
MKHEERLRILFNYNPFLGFLGSNAKLWENLSFITMFSINVIVCFSYSQQFMDETGVAKDAPDYHEVLLHERLYDPRFLFQRNLKDTLQVIITFGLIELVLASIIVFFFLLKRAPLKIYSIWVGFFDL